MTPKAQAFLDALMRLCEHHGIHLDVVSYEPVFLHTLVPGAAPLDLAHWADATDDPTALEALPATQPPIWSEYLPGEGYYLHIAMFTPLDAMLTAFFESGIPLPFPRTPENDTDIQALIDVLQRLSARLSHEHPC